MSAAYWRHFAFRAGKPDAVVTFLNVRSAGHYITYHDFRDDGGRRDLLELLWCKNGEGVVQNYGKDIKMSAGDCFVYLPGSCRGTSSRKGNWDYYWFACDGPDLDTMIRVFNLKQELRRGGTCPENLFNTVIDSLHHIDAAGTIRASAAACEILMLALNPSTTRSASRELADRFQEMVAKSFADPDFTVHSAAEALAVHRSTLHRLFFARCGVSPQDYLSSYRLQQALELLHTGMNIKEISERCGFNAQHYFAKVFRRCFGKNPAEFRRTLVTVRPPESE